METLSLEPAEGAADCYDENYEQQNSDEEQFPLTQPSPEITEVDVEEEDAPLPAALAAISPKPTPTGFASKYATESAGSPIDGEVAVSLEYLMTNQLAEKPLMDTMDKYDTPSNCTALKVPKVNPFIWDSIQGKTHSLDLKLQRVQKSLVKGMMANAKGLDKPTESQQDAFTCLANANFELNMLRREIIKPDMHAKFAPLCKPSVPVTEFLFGDDLSRNIRDLTEVHKATDQVMKMGHQTKKRFNPYYRGRGRRGRGNFLGSGAGYQQPRRNFQPYQQQQYQQQYLPALTARRGRGRGKPPQTQ